MDALAAGVRGVEDYSVLIRGHCFWGGRRRLVVTSGAGYRGGLVSGYPYRVCGERCRWLVGGIFGTAGVNAVGYAMIEIYSFILYS